MAFGSAVQQYSTLTPEEQDELAKQAAADQAAAAAAQEPPPPDQSAPTSPPPPPAQLSATEAPAQDVANATVPDDIAAINQTQQTQAALDPGLINAYAEEGLQPPDPATQAPPTPTSPPPPPPLGAYGAGTKFTTGTAVPPPPKPYGPSTSQGYQTQLGASPTPSEFGEGSTVSLPPMQGGEPGWFTKKRAWDGGPNIISQTTGYVPPEFTPPPTTPITDPVEIARGMGTSGPIMDPEGTLNALGNAAGNVPSLDWGDVGDAANAALGTAGYVGSQVQNEAMTMSPQEQADLLAGLVVGGAPARPGAVELGGWGQAPGTRAAEEFLGGPAPERVPPPATTTAGTPISFEDLSLARSTGRDIGGIKELGGTRESDPLYKVPEPAGFWRSENVAEPSARTPEAARTEAGPAPGPRVPERAGIKPTDTGLQPGSAQPTGDAATPVRPRISAKTVRVAKGEIPGLRPEAPVETGQVRPAGAEPGAEANPVEGPAQPAARPKTLDEYINEVTQSFDKRRAMTDAERAQADRIAQEREFQATHGRSQDAWLSSSEEMGGPTTQRSRLGEEVTGKSPTRTDAQGNVYDSQGKVIPELSPTGKGQSRPAGSKAGGTTEAATGGPKSLREGVEQRIIDELSKPTATGRATEGGAPAGKDSTDTSKIVPPTRKSALDDAIGREVDQVSAQQTKPLTQAERERAVNIASQKIQEWFGQDTPVGGGRPSTRVVPPKQTTGRGLRTDYARPGEPFTTSRTYQEAPPQAKGEPFYAGKTFEEAPPQTKGEPFTTSRDYQEAPAPDSLRTPEQPGAARAHEEAVTRARDEAAFKEPAETETVVADDGTTTTAPKGSGRKFPSKKTMLAALGAGAFGAAAYQHRTGGGSTGTRSDQILARERTDIASPGAYTAYEQGLRKGMHPNAGMSDASSNSGIPGFENVQVFVNPDTGQAEGAIDENGDYKPINQDQASLDEMKRIRDAGGSPRSGYIDADGNYVVSDAPVSGTGTVWNQPPPPRTAGLEAPISPPSEPGAVTPLATGASEAAGTPAAGGTPLLTGERTDTGGSGSGWHTYGSSSRYSGGGSRYGGSSRRKKKKGSYGGSGGTSGGFWPGFPFNRPNSPIRQHVLDAIAASLAEGKARKGR